AETDQQGVAYHANYFVWMEIGRTRYLEALGYPYHRMEAEGALFSVMEARCRYAGAARYGEHVAIATRVTAVRSRSVAFGYELAAGGRPLATGETVLIALDRERRPRRIPAEVARALERGPGWETGGRRPE
ncbi:MAG TPA: thioesterase family protein, partial [Gemmatimonadota bacterium]|nr:thioesterase family protein [Gemmatimonadota bacterium]